MKPKNKLIEARNCRGCGGLLPPPFLNLESTPLANSYVKEDSPPEELFPLAVSFCGKCYLAQLTHHIRPSEIFSDYAYFSSYSTSFLEHAKKTVEDLNIEYHLNDKHVMEIGSNDGYLLQYVKSFDILGIEPASNIADAATKKGIPTLNKFFGTDLIKEILGSFGQSDVIIGNNVLAHVPQINDFVQAVAECLKSDGVATFEFPYLFMLMNKMEFDTIYHEHVFYYSILALKNIFQYHKLEIFNVKFSSVHGGSIRIFVGHEGSHPIQSIVSYYEMIERCHGMDDYDAYYQFAARVGDVKARLRGLIGDLHWRGKSIAAYGAPAKGNTLLNYCSLGKDIIDFTVDISPHKQGFLLPGTRIPIYPREHLLKSMPDYTILLPWNVKDEIMSQQSEYLAKGGQFIIPIPTPRVIR